MKAIFFPSKPQGTIDAPPSKSLTHRYLISGALSDESNIYNISHSLDVDATLNCLRSLGAKIKEIDNIVTIGGLDFKNISTLNCNESGSTLRFLIPLCLSVDFPITLTGTKKLFSRPLYEYEKLCKEQKLYYKKTENSVTLCGPLKSGNFTVDGSTSSQFVSGLLFALPLLKEKSTITITGTPSSTPYIDLTVKALNEFGIVINKKSDTLFEIPGNQKYKNRSVFVEGDYSNAAFIDAFNLLGGNVTVNNLNPKSIQGDKVYKEYFKMLKKGHNEIDLKEYPDLAPILFTAAPLLNGATFINTSRLRFKESNRAECMKEELKKFGIELQVNENSVTIEKCNINKPTSILYSHNDHRIAMALCILCSLFGGEIDGVEAVNKSYPEFFYDLKRLNIKFYLEQR